MLKITITASWQYDFYVCLNAIISPQYLADFNINCMALYWFSSLVLLLTCHRDLLLSGWEFRGRIPQTQGVFVMKEGGGVFVSSTVAVTAMSKQSNTHTCSDARQSFIIFVTFPM